MSHQLDGHTVGSRHLESPGQVPEKTVVYIADNFYSKISLAFFFFFLITMKSALIQTRDNSGTLSVMC